MYDYWLFIDMIFLNFSSSVQDMKHSRMSQHLLLRVWNNDDWLIWSSWTWEIECCSVWILLYRDFGVGRYAFFILNHLIFLNFILLVWTLTLLHLLPVLLWRVSLLISLYLDVPYNDKGTYDKHYIRVSGTSFQNITIDDFDIIGSSAFPTCVINKKCDGQ